MLSLTLLEGQGLWIQTIVLHCSCVKAASVTQVHMLILKAVRGREMTSAAISSGLRKNFPSSLLPEHFWRFSIGFRCRFKTDIESKCITFIWRIGSGRRRRSSSTFESMEEEVSAVEEPKEEFFFRRTKTRTRNYYYFLFPRQGILSAK